MVAMKMVRYPGGLDEKSEKTEVKDDSYMCSLSKGTGEITISQDGNSWERSKFEMGGYQLLFAHITFLCK